MGNEIDEKLKLLKDDFIRATKRILKSDKPVNNQTLKSVKEDIINTYNNYIGFNISIWHTLDDETISNLNNHFDYLRTKLKSSFKALNCNFFIPNNPLTKIDINIVEINTSSEKQIDNGEKLDKLETNKSSVQNFQSKSIENLVSSHNLENNPQGNKNNFVAMCALSSPDFLKLASSTINKNFSGDPLSLQSFIDSLNLLQTLATTEDLKKLLITFALTKLEGKAREAVTELPENLTNLIDSLKSKIKPESSKVIEGKIQALRTDKMPLQDFAKRTEELAEQFRRSLIVEGIPSMKAEEMTVSKTVEMCRANARTDLVKSVLASTSFSSHKEVISKFIVETNAQIQERQVLAFRPNRGQINNFPNTRRYFEFNNRSGNTNYHTRNKYNPNNNIPNNFNRGTSYRNYRNSSSFRDSRNNERSQSNQNVLYTEATEYEQTAGNVETPQWELGASDQQSSQ